LQYLWQYLLIVYFFAFEYLSNLFNFIVGDSSNKEEEERWIIMGKEFIYFEKQDDLMCGQHALNMLLQRKEFDASHFTQYVESLDQRERELTGVPSETFKSQNASESGYFSIQVLQEALISQHLGLHIIDKPNYAKFMFHPEEAHAFIVNQSQHWYAIRRFGDMWFILNSISNGPRYIATPLLQPYLVQLIQNFASIYIVEGDLGVCEADIAAACGELATDTSAPPPVAVPPPTIEEIRSNRAEFLARFG